MATRQASSEGARLAAEPWIVERAADIARPRARVEPCGDLAHLPGDSGAFAGIRTIAGMLRHGEAYFLRQHERFGPVYRSRLGSDPVVFVLDPDHAFAIVRNEDGVWSTALGWWLIFDGLISDSETMDMPVVLDFASHRDARRLLQPAFSPAALESYIGAALDSVEREIPGWYERGRVAFKPAVRRLFANVASRIFIGVDDPAEAKALDRALADFWRGPMALVKHPLLSPNWRRAQRAWCTLHSSLRSQVVPRRTQLQGGEDLFSRLCRTPHDIAWLDDDAMVRLFFGVMAAAFDTTSLGVTAMAYLLALHPEWQERVRRECLRIDIEQMARTELNELEETDWAWKESLRLFPVAGDVPRIALREVQLGAHRIPAGTYVFPRLGALHRHPAWWTEPERFDPERFSPGRAEHKRHRGIYLPFGGGVHACIGAQLASMEAKILFHRLLSRGRIRLSSEAKARHQYRPLGQVSGDVELILEAL